MRETATVPSGCPLTPRQWQMLRLLARGPDQKRIALGLRLSHSTVRSTLRNAYRRLGVRSGAQAVAVAHSAGWMDPVDTEWEDGRVTAAQSLYLAAFDRFLLAGRDEGARTRARAEMRHLLGTMCIERQVPVPSGGRRRPDHGVDSLMRLVCS